MILKKKYIRFPCRIRAGALQYTIAFSLLTILILVSFLLFNHLRQVELAQYEVWDKLRRDMASAQLILEERPGLFTGSGEEMKLVDENFLNELDITIKEWGFFHTVSIRASHGHIKKKKIFLYSDDIRLNKLSPSLYLSDPRKHLSIGGKAYLGNNTFLPSYGIREAYINGVKYQRSSLVHGLSRKAAPKLPALRGKWQTSYTAMVNGISPRDRVLNWEDIQSDSIVNSFSDERLIIRCPDKTIIDRKIIIGNVVLLGTDIELRNTSVLESCIVLAKSISIGAAFKGAAQFIAASNIDVGSGTVLMYPSVLFCKATKSGSGIRIQDECQIEGDIIVPSGQKSFELFKTGRNTQIIGQVYCHGLVTFHGTLLGSMYCLGFIDRTREGVFRNYIYDVCIDFERLPKEYGGVSLIHRENEKKCIQELL